MTKDYSAQVHWHEGLFLQPHHLQYLQRQLLNQVSGQRRLGYAYPYGLIEARLSADALENMLVRFDRLRVVMPSGLEVVFPDNADLPALDIKKAFDSSSEPFTVSLGVPLWYANRANTIETPSDDDWRIKRLYRISEINQTDENSGENPRALQVRRVNARLLLEGDDLSDIEVLPLLRIAHATGEDVGLPKQDPLFVPACFVLQGSPALRDLVRDLTHQVEATRKSLVLQITRGGFSIETMRGLQFEQVMRLRTLNRYSARLPSLVASASVTPFEMYVELRELLGELAALYPHRDPFEVSPYNHDNPWIAFRELSERIRSLLPGGIVANFLKAPFVREDKIFLAALTDEHLSKPNEYFLGIKTKEDPRALAQLVEDGDRFKLMAKSRIDQAIYGVKLAEERHPPLELPSQVGLHYFRLVRSEGRMWGQIVAEKQIAIRWRGSEASDFELMLYMTVPPEEGES